MKNEFKWMLQSGRFVEDVLYEAGKAISYEHMFHSFAYDVDDTALQKHFLHEKINELRAKNVKEDPTLCLEMQELLQKLSEQSTCGGLKSITGLAGRFGNKHDIKTDFDIKSVVYATESLLTLWEAPAKPLFTPQSEHCHDIHIWGPVVDNLSWMLNV